MFVSLAADDDRLRLLMKRITRKPASTPMAKAAPTAMPTMAPVVILRAGDADELDDDEDDEEVFNPVVVVIFGGAAFTVGSGCDEQLPPTATSRESVVAFAGHRVKVPASRSTIK
jgi:hypothetical protein